MFATSTLVGTPVVAAPARAARPARSTRVVAAAAKKAPPKKKAAGKVRHDETRDRVADPPRAFATPRARRDRSARRARGGIASTATLVRDASPID